MLFIISPAKSLNEENIEISSHSMPRMLDESQTLVSVLKKKSARQLKKMMSVSDDIASLNVNRYQEFGIPFTTDNSKPAIYLFDGDVYLGLDAASLGKRDIAYAQKNLRILSGLYGILKPLDLIQPYRLEMGTRLKFRKWTNLYGFWGTKITKLINDDLAENKDDIIINLASKEYFKSVKTKELNGRLIHVGFRELRKGEYKLISFSSKKARGMMCHYAIKNKLTNPEDLKKFSYDGYKYSKELSSENEFMFWKPGPK